VADCMTVFAAADPTYVDQLEPIFDGLRKAGVPEQ
jgi:hypothetical protein